MGYQGENVGCEVGRHAIKDQLASLESSNSAYSKEKTGP
jgi:hypothetical protein